MPDTLGAKPPSSPTEVEIHACPQAAQRVELHPRRRARLSPSARSRAVTIMHSWMSRLLLARAPPFRRRSSAGSATWRSGPAAASGCDRGPSLCIGRCTRAGQRHREKSRWRRDADLSEVPSSSRKRASRAPLVRHLHARKAHRPTGPRCASALSTRCRQSVQGRRSRSSECFALVAGGERRTAPRPGRASRKRGQAVACSVGLPRESRI